MATATRGRFRRHGPDERPLRVLTAAATRVNLDDRTEAKRLRKLRQGWQSQAWDFRDSIGELRYAIEFLANCTRRMKLYPAAYATTGEADNPVPLSDVADIPTNVQRLATEAIEDLGHGRLAISNLLHSLSTNTSTAGEAWLLGRTDEKTGEDVWTIRSVDEIVISDDRYQLREVPSDSQGTFPLIELDPELTVISRIWTPHPRFRMLADSPLRAMLDDCESLMILRRMIRATGRSRLNAGILRVPDEISIKVPVDDDADPEADPFMAALTEAMMEPISEEGAAGAVVPIVVRGPGDKLAQLDHLSLASTFSAEEAKVRDELIGIIATSFDLPKEIVQGIADMNHWSAWQVDDNTFRHHVEPHVIGICESLTGAYLRPYLESRGVSPQVASRVLFWYDPTELVTHPDQTKDALDLHDRLVISDEALLKIAGFDEQDRPAKSEIQVRLLEKMRQWPPNLVMAFLHQWDPTLIAPPIETAGTIPGIKPTGVDVGTPPPNQIAPPGRPALPSQPAEPAPAKPAAEQPEQGPPPVPITASGSRESHRLSQKLASIDRDLRTRLQTAANAAMLRHLERVGAKLRTKVNNSRDETGKQKIAHRRNERVSAVLGREAVEALTAATGVSTEDLTGNEWSDLRSQFYEWTEAAQKAAVATAIRLGGLASEDDAVLAAESSMAAGRDTAWGVLSNALTNIGRDLLYNPDPNVGPGDWGDLNPDTLVPTGTIRAALGIAGGGDLGLDPAGKATVALGEPIGQIGTGATIETLLTEAGATTTGFQWVHGPALKAFEPHELLDGVEFQGFDDEALANTTGWPDNAYFMPGDHTGCSCDFLALWVSPEAPEGG
ncbi:MAG TPA: hypothetical protein VGN13_12490 [Solirubrobacteraceae bacterium]|jgi:hypothetical protein